MTKAFKANRYGDEGDYINCPMNEEEYKTFWRELVNAETAPRHDFEEEQMRHFDGCLPVEVIAKRGEQTLLFGPLRPVGFEAANAGETPYAVVQLRQDNTEGDALQHRRLPDQSQMGGAGARLPSHPGAEER